MPLIDLPLEQLYTYAGRNPRPADFDGYWDRGLAELPDPQMDLKPAEFRAASADCLDLWFTGIGGAKIYAKYVRPRADQPAPAILMFHGYSVSSGDWLDKLAWAAEGYHVLAMDCRGQGGRSEDLGAVKGNTLRGHIIRGLDDAPEKLLYRSIFLDTAQLARIALSLDGVDASRLYATGASQGGGLSLACAALEPRVSKVFSFYPFLCDYLRVWEMDQAKDAYDEIRAYFRLFDPTHSREKETFERLGYIDIQHLAPRIRAEIRMVTGLMDTITPPSTQFAAYNKITSPKEVILYPDFGHEGLPGAGDMMHSFFAK